MASGRYIKIMRDGQNKPEHLIMILKNQRQVCWCSRDVKVFQKKLCYVTSDTTLTCKVCEARRVELEKWWQRCEDAEREAERQQGA